MAEKHPPLPPAHDPLGYDSPTGRRHVGPVIIFVALIWIALWGDISLANGLAGIGVGLAVTRLAPLPPTGRRYRPTVSGLVRFGWVLTVALVTSTIEVAARVLGPTSSLTSRVIEVVVGPRDPFVLAMAANATTLTPGTLTLDIDPATGTLTIHVLHLRAEDEEGVRAETVRFADLAEAALRPTRPKVVSQE